MNRVHGRQWKEQYRSIERLGRKMGIWTASRQNREMRKFVVGIVRNTDMDPLDFCMKVGYLVITKTDYFVITINE